jgi:hypothetical protein
MFKFKSKNMYSDDESHMQENNEIWNEGEFFNSKNDEENNCATKS